LQTANTQKSELGKRDLNILKYQTGKELPEGRGDYDVVGVESRLLETKNTLKEYRIRSVTGG